jgi:hypothetical protein
LPKALVQGGWEFQEIKRAGSDNHGRLDKKSSTPVL